jgi:hypothetical protein
MRKKWNDRTCSAKYTAFLHRGQSTPPPNDPNLAPPPVDVGLRGFVGPHSLPVGLETMGRPTGEEIEPEASGDIADVGIVGDSSVGERF